MRIFDCFIFHDELDILETRVRHLEGIVDAHILVESATTHQGNPKPLYFRENRERFDLWDILDIGVNIAIPGKDRDSCWQRQAMQREAIREGLKAVEAEDDDIILFGDVDEIPDRDLIDDDMPLPAAWRMEHRLFAVDWVHPERWGVATVAVRYGDIGSFEALRNSDRNSFPHVFDDGWHFSWLGGPDAIKAKARSWAHTELADMMWDWADEGMLYERGWSTRASDVRTLSVRMKAAGTDGLPQWIQDRKCPAMWFRPENKLTWKKGAR
jgi:Glycosyltransferase family 17